MFENWSDLAEMIATNPGWWEGLSAEARQRLWEQAFGAAGGDEAAAAISGVAAPTSAGVAAARAADAAEAGTSLS